MAKKPFVVVTRKLPERIETRMRELFDARLNLDDEPLSAGDLAVAMAEADVLVPTVTDRIDAGLIDAAGRSSSSSPISAPASTTSTSTPPTVAASW